ANRGGNPDRPDDRDSPPCGEIGVGTVGDIAFDANGNLFGAGPCGPNANGNLYSIDKMSGLATFLGAIAAAGPRTGLGLSFFPLVSTPQQLFVVPEPTNQNMCVINPANGAIVNTIALSGGDTDAINSLTIDPAGTTLLGVKKNSLSPATVLAAI